MYTIVFNPVTGYTVSPIPDPGGGGTLQYANLAAFPATGSATITYVALDTDILYYWDGAAYVALSSAGGGGANTYLDVTASRDYAAATDNGKILRPSPTSSSFTVTIQTTSGQAAGDVFATSKPAAGTLTVAAGAGITLNDNDALQAGQAAHDFPLGFTFESTTVANVG